MEGDIQSTAIRGGGKRGSEGRKERGERMVSIKKHWHKKRTEQYYKKVVVGWNKGMRTCAHLMIEK